jgi:hypothetical protein
MLTGSSSNPGAAREIPLTSIVITVAPLNSTFPRNPAKRSKFDHQGSSCEHLAQSREQSQRIPVKNSLPLVF